MFGNGITVQTHTGNLFIDAEAAYHQERMLEAARGARQARQAQLTGTRAPRPLARLRQALRHTAAGATAAR